MRAPVALPRPSAQPGLARPLRVRRRYLLLLALVVLFIAGLVAPALRVAPAALYLMVADLPGVPAGPLNAALGDPTRNDWSFSGAEGLVRADLYTPRGGGIHPTMLIVNGAISTGRKYPPLAQFAANLARSGYTALVPDYPDLLREELTPASLQDVEYTLQQLSGLAGANPARVELLGFCVGGTLSLLTAEDPRMPSLRAVIDLAGYASSVDMIQVITTDTYTLSGRTVPFTADPWVVVAVARSLVSALPDAADRAQFAPLLVDPPPDHYLPPDWSRLPPDHLSPGGRALLALLRNRDAARLPALIAALPPPLPAQLTALSPLGSLSRLRSPVFIVADRSDQYIPNAESVRLAQGRPDLVHLSYVSLLSHTEPEFQSRSTIFATAWDVATGVWQFFRAIDQALAVLQ